MGPKTESKAHPETRRVVDGGEACPQSAWFDERIVEVFAERGLEGNTPTAPELREMEQAAAPRLKALFGEIADRWQEEHRPLSEQERIDRELRRRIIAKRSDSGDDSYVCEGCGYRNREHLYFSDFHGIYLCDACVYEAREELRDIQRPLVEVLEAEPTVANALALGYELVRQGGRLVWIGDDDDFDGGDYPYADEDEALENLVAELT